MTTHQMSAPAQPRPLAIPPSVPVGLATFTQIVAATWMALAVGRAIAAPVVASSVIGRRADPDIAFFVVDALASLSVLVQLLAFIIAGLWLYFFVEAARQLNPEARHEREAYWSFVGWIAPVVNLWFPHQVVRDAAAAVGARTRVLPWWWAGWIVTGVLAAAESVALALSPDDLTPWLIVSAVLAVATLVTGVLWIRVVSAMTAAARASITVEP